MKALLTLILTVALIIAAWDAISRVLMTKKKYYWLEVIYAFVVVNGGAFIYSLIVKHILAL